MHYKLLLAGCLLASIGFTAQSAQAATAVTGSITTTTWTVANSPYYITARASVETGNTLTIEPGVVVKFDDGASLNVAGNLVAEGTADDLIIFTSLKDDSYGGDTNGDGSATTPYFGDWDGVVLPTQRPTPTALFDHVIMQYGGRVEDSAMLTLRSGTVSITNSSFHSSSNMLLYALELADVTIDQSSFDATGSSYWFGVIGSGTVTNSSFSGPDQVCLYASDMVAVSGNRFTDCYYGVQLYSADTSVTDNIITASSYGIYWTGTTGTPTITNNTIYDNVFYGIYNSSRSYNLPAENNWWGDATGPYHTSNPSGLGDNVSDSVDFDPWLSADPTSDTVSPAEITLGDITKDPWNKTITLNWTNPTDEDFDHLQIDRTAADGSVVTLTATEEGIIYTDSDIEYDMAYAYTLYAIDQAGNSSTGISSAEYRVRSPQVKHLRLTARERTILSRWSRLPLRSTAGYLVYYGTAPDALTSVIDVGPNSRRILTDLRGGQTYYVAVAAYNRDRVIGPLSTIQSIAL